MILLDISPQSLSQAAQVIRSGGLAAFPTETVYGLGADAYNSEAVVKIFEAKGRPRFDPLIIHIADPAALEETADLSQLGRKTRDKVFLLAAQLWPGPLSLVLPKSKKIPAIVTAGLDTAAIRLPDHDAARQFIRLSGGAIAAPSANPFGSLSPTTAQHVRDGLGDKVDIILDGGPTRIGVESTVLEITADCIRILRPGGTTREQIEKIAGTVINNNSDRSLISPGQLKSHYAPGTPLSVFTRDEIIRKPACTGCAFLFFDNAARDEWQYAQQGVNIRVLSPSGQLVEAASQLFEILHELDSSNITCIYAQLAPEQGLGEAINDRLRRAHRGNIG
jgi:L-threonylcarbamoyladenylate synthase